MTPAKKATTTFATAIAISLAFGEARAQPCFSREKDRVLLARKVPS